MDRTLLITNAAAGTNDRESVDLALAVLRQTLDVEVAATRDVAELDAALDARDGRPLVVAGGDGSLHAVVAALHRRGELGDVTLGLVPLGTGNDFARSLQIPLAAADAARIVTQGRDARIDLLVDDEDGIVVNAVHVGVGVDAAREARAWKRSLGRIGYPIGAAIAGFKGGRGSRVRVRVDNLVVADGHRRVLQVGVGNGSFVGGGTALVPDADPTDGILDVMVSFTATRLQRLLYVVHLKLGTHTDRHDVHVVRGTRVEVRGRGFSYNADGELSASTRRRVWELRPGAYTLRVPSAEQAVAST